MHSCITRARNKRPILRMMLSIKAKAMSTALSSADCVDEIIFSMPHKLLNSDSLVLPEACELFLTWSYQRFALQERKEHIVIPYI